MRSYGSFISLGTVMKLSLAWIFDHIDAAWQDQDVNHIMQRFNAVTAEIEHVESINIELTSFALCRFKKSDGTISIVTVPEWNMECALPARQDLTSDAWFMVKKDGSEIVWARLSDFGVDKGGFIPAIEAEENLVAGAWRTLFEARDVIIEVDNKSITHRPDMWGHRGFAREIAAFLKLPLKSESDLLVPLRVQTFDVISTMTPTTPFLIENRDQSACSCFTGLYFSSITQQPCNLLIMSRLLKIGARPINGLVDLTNYVMNDWGNPVHAYDADRIAEKKIIIRRAVSGEQLDLLDGSQARLTTDDLVIADACKPMCLAGIKGGVGESLSQTTKSIFFEAATFDAGTVRRSSIRHKLRTDASARFEKTLDPIQAVQTTQRFVRLLKNHHVAMAHADEIVVVGNLPQEILIEVSHDFIEQRMGVTLVSSQIIDMLSRLEFKVLKTSDTKKKALYMVSVPTFRASKDIKNKEDILEEILRCYGFDKIPLTLPVMARSPFSLERIMRLRKLKQYLSYAANMIEQQGYAFLDEGFAKQLNISFETSSTLINPVSENFTRLIPTLIPNLLKNVYDNFATAESIAFYEVGRVWSGRTASGELNECQHVTGIFFEKRDGVDFYSCKAIISELLRMLGFPANIVSWRPCVQKHPWLHPYQAAEVFVGDTSIGYVGMIDAEVLRKLGCLEESQAWLFDLDADVLLNPSGEVTQYKPLSKFQETFFDVSLLVPLAVTTGIVQKMIAEVDPLIRRVELIDFFEKSEWHDVRSMTIRCWVCHDEKTLEKHELDALWQKVLTVLEPHGMRIRC